MFDIALRPTIPAMSPEALDRAHAISAAMLEMPQVPIKITHNLWAGVYARTCEIPKGAAVAGVVLKKDMIFALAGEALVYIGTDEPLHLVGYNVLSGSAGRKQIIYAIERTWITASFATAATTVEEAEAEATDQTALLASRRGLDKIEGQ